MFRKVYDFNNFKLVDAETDEVVYEHKCKDLSEQKLILINRRLDAGRYKIKSYYRFELMEGWITNAVLSLMKNLVLVALFQILIYVSVAIMISPSDFSLTTFSPDGLLEVELKMLSSFTEFFVNWILTQSFWIWTFLTLKDIWKFQKDNEIQAKARGN